MKRILYDVSRWAVYQHRSSRGLPLAEADDGARPGRQAANGAELREVIAGASGCPARILSANEEGQLAFIGALSAASQPASQRVAVVDVVRGSAQVVVGTRSDGPLWVRSIDLGSQRLTSRMLAH